MGAVNPWLTGQVYNGTETQICDGDSRLQQIRDAGPDQLDWLRQVIAWPNNQSTVRKAAESKLRRLEREADNARAEPGGA